MNNMFLEGPIQTGKSTLIRNVLAEFFGPALDGVGGFTCQRITFPTRSDAEGQRPSPVQSAAEGQGQSPVQFSADWQGPSPVQSGMAGPGTGRRFGFRLMPASAPISAHTCVVASDEDLKSSAGLFKLVGNGKPYVNLNVFETTGVQLMEDALSRAKSENAGADKVSIILLDEIGGHEMICPKFRETLYELLESDVPCIGVVKLEESARRMVSRRPGPEADAIIEHNLQLHKKITGPDGRSGEILYFERGDEQVANSLREFAGKCPRA